MSTAVTPASPLTLRLPVPDFTLVVLALALLLIGLIAISSASIEYAEWHYQNTWYHTQRHLIYLALALSMGLAAYSVESSFWLRSGWLWLFLALGLLILVLIPGVGREVNGSQRWLPLGLFTLQPSEIAKLAIVLYLAGYVVRREQEVREQWGGFFKPMGVVGVAALLLMAGPDFGATVIIAGSAFGMLFLAGVHLGHFLTLLGGALGALVTLIFIEPYRLKRLMSYTDPWADPFGAGFQPIQSMIAFGRGEWTGVGLGNSVQKLFYLPEAHTDFVYSIWAEEMGFVGALVVIALYTALIGRIFWTGRQALLAKNPFGAYICYGVALVFAGQAFVNMGVSSGLLPTKGLTLPFISYGGSSLIICCVMLAIVLRVDHETRQVPVARRRK